jgi:hypothetical protein
MAHTQKPDFVFRRNRRVHSIWRGLQFIRLLAAEVFCISGSNAGYTMFRGGVKGTGYALHSPICPLLPLPCVTVCHHISTGLYLCVSNTLVAVAVSVTVCVSHTLVVMAVGVALCVALNRGQHTAVTDETPFTVRYGLRLQNQFGVEHNSTRWHDQVAALP